MKKMFLIGDSIRLGAHEEDGYGVILKRMLEGKAEVYYPDDNCRFAMYTLRYLNEWAKIVPCADEIDFVLWNNGLWDTLHLTGEEVDAPFTSYEDYLKQMERVYKRIKYIFPNAKIAFVSSTNVIEEMAPPESTRDNTEIQKYNSGMKELAEKWGIDYIDLYPVAEKIPVDLRTDWVHYKSEGSKIFAEEIYRCLTMDLGVL